MSLIDRFRKWRDRRDCKRHGHDWVDVATRPERSGWVGVLTCGRCGVEEKHPIGRATRRLLQGKDKHHNPTWRKLRRARRSAFKGIYTTDQAIESRRRVRAAFARLDQQLRERGFDV